jgi:hypothetical protein
MGRATRKVIRMVALVPGPRAVVWASAYGRGFIAAIPLVLRKIKIERIGPGGESDYR